VYLDGETMGRFLEYLRGQGRTDKYRRNVRTYLASWAEASAGKCYRARWMREKRARMSELGDGEGSSGKG
jgi:hypothetical protein